MSQHSSCWLARHQFFIKYCITEKETFKGEEKLNLLFQLRLWWFWHFIRWLTDCMKEEASGTSFTELYRLSSLLFIYLFFSSLSTLISPTPWGTAHIARMSWLYAWQSLYHCAFASASTNASFGSLHVATWIRTGHNSILLNLNTTMHFMVAKGKKVMIKFKNLSRAIFKIIAFWSWVYLFFNEFTPTLQFWGTHTLLLWHKFHTKLFCVERLLDKTIQNLQKMRSPGSPFFVYKSHISLSQCRVQQYIQIKSYSCPGGIIKFIWSWMRTDG